MHLRINVQEGMCAQSNMVKKSVQGNFVDGARCMSNFYAEDQNLLLRLWTEISIFLSFSNCNQMF